MRKINWNNIDASSILISNPKNIRHFTNLKTSFGFVLITKEETILFADSRYFELANKVFDGKVVLYKGKDTLKEYTKSLESMAIEKDFVTLEMFEFFKELNSNVKTINGQSLRMVKSKEDIASLQKAVDITKRVMQWASEQMKVGMTEKELSILVSSKLATEGSEELDYAPIIAGGPNSSKPHAEPGDRKFQEGDTVMFDFAAVVDGFTADLTRNYSIGTLTNKELIKIEEIVRRAKKAGTSARAQKYVKALGGYSNITMYSHCATRLRYDIKDPAKVNDKALQAAGAFGVSHPSKTHVQVVVGPTVEILNNEILAGKPKTSKAKVVSGVVAS